jgi:phosphoglycolate phosphatase-like HAD superfamily hydrolase
MDGFLKYHHYNQDCCTPNMQRDQEMENLDTSRIKALCFDIDGTLSDTDDQFVLRVERWLSPLKFLFLNRDPRPFARKVVMKTETPGNVVYSFADRLGIDNKIAHVGNFIYEKGIGKSDKPFLLIPGVLPALELLSKHYPMAVVSARGKRTTEKFLEQFHLTGFFKAIATAQTCDHTKPYPDPIFWVAKEMGYPAHQCLMIGDTTVDILAARAAGAQSVGVLCGFGEKEELEVAGADLILEHTALLSSILPG